MGYYETLDEMLKKSGLTLQEVADRCEKDYGVKINRSYISKLKTVRQAPASDEINEAIAKVCGANVEEFLYEAYLEKAPEFIRVFIKSLVEVTRDISISALKTQQPEEEIPIIDAHLRQLSDIEFLKKISKFRMNISSIKVKELIDLDEKGQNEISDRIFDITMDNISMEPTIPKGSIIHIDKNASISSSDIVVMSFINTYEYEIKRYYPNLHEMNENIDYEIIFTSDNPEFEPLVVNRSDIKILGKITGITTHI
ncbi:hypothetical protein J31TS6_61120 [Brevibacillus reuszeri]|uniref:LexA family transcriptional regulator n=1 Tax=Brevibacillus reuszeri TaxID=54915 RepID=UPI001B118B71|nr:LexA family transcriptional regulator [Brevibacillus reuszeri]GIO10084.1 hypothetical protein J31TS6_61120 [Brevibacillus reuszeri]